MADSRNIQDLIEASEDALFQTIIDRQEGALGIAEQSGQPPAGAVPERWRQALDGLDGPHSRCPRRVRRKRIFLVAAIIVLLLLATVAACATQFFGLFLNIQTEFTQPRTQPGPEATVKTWTELPIPTYTPTGFFISDAASDDGIATIEYSNSEGQRFSIFYNNTESNIHIDSEMADQSTQFTLEGVTVYLLEKDGLFTLYWSCGPTIVSVEFHPEEVSLDEIKELVVGMNLPT